MHEHEVCELQSLENGKEQIKNLDHEITEQEIRQAVKKLKNKKSPFVDKINFTIRKNARYLVSRPYNPNLQIR